MASAAAAVLLVATTTAVARPAPASAERRAVIFFTGAVHGELEPCGCTSDPLGDIARMTNLVRTEAKETKHVLLVDAGNLSYGLGETSLKRRRAADLKAAFLAEQYMKLPLAGAALGATDLSRGPDKVVPKRLAANVVGAAFVVESPIREVGGIKIGVLGLTAPAVARQAGLKVEDPVEAARREAQRLRDRGAEVVIALAAMERAQARQVARGAAIDFVIAGQETGAGLERADPIGGAHLLAPAAELQKVGRLELVVRGTGQKRLSFVDAGSPHGLALDRAEAERALIDLDREIERWEKDPAADAAFVAARRRERQALFERKAALGTARWSAPTSGSYFSARLIPLRRALPRDPALAAAMRRLDQEMGRASLAHAQPPPKAEAGRAAFAGDKSCATCHKPAAGFWKKTVHANAWKTLVVGGKTLQEDCVSCHVTGFGEVGGSSLGFTKGLEAVQCETCHGPGSVHVAQQGLEEPPAIRLSTPESTCAFCHNEKHSDTFQYAAYLRDVLGPGHGEKARAQLGAGPTARELRAAAKARAKAAGMAQIREM